MERQYFIRQMGGLISNQKIDKKMRNYARIVLAQDFQNVLDIDIQQIAPIKNWKDQRNKTKANNAEKL